MGGSAARKLRRTFARSAGGSTEKANYAVDLLEQLLERTAGQQGQIRELQEHYTELVENIKKTISTIAVDFNKLLNAHNSTTLALGKTVEVLAQRGIHVLPPGQTPAQQTRSGIALPAGVTWQDVDPENPETEQTEQPAGSGPLQPGGDATIASAPDGEAVGGGDPAPGPRPESRGGA